MSNSLYGSGKIKITKLPAGKAYDLKDSKPITAGSSDLAFKGTRSPYSRISKKKGGTVADNKTKGTKSKASTILGKTLKLPVDVLESVITSDGKILRKAIQDIYKETQSKRNGGSMSDKKNKKVPTPITKKEAFARHKKKTGSYHKADPLHPMNRESMIGKKYGGSMKSKNKSGSKCSHNRLY